MNKKVSSESVVKDIRRKTREMYSIEERNRILNCPIWERGHGIKTPIALNTQKRYPIATQKKGA